MSATHEKDLHSSDEAQSYEDTAPIIGTKSPGVQRIEAVASHITTADRIAIFSGVFLIAYAYGLDGTLRYVYQVSLNTVVYRWTTDAWQPVATNSYSTHSTLATIAAIRAVIAAAAQVCYSKLTTNCESNLLPAHCSQDRRRLWPSRADSRLYTILCHRHNRRSGFQRRTILRCGRGLVSGLCFVGHSWKHAANDFRLDTHAYSSSSRW